MNPKSFLACCSILMVSLVLGTPLMAQTKAIYTSPDFESIAGHERILAIIPFDASIHLRPREMKNITPDQLKEMQLKEGKDLQSALESYFLKKRLNVSLQSTEQTNAILIKNHIYPDSLDAYTTSDLCRILNVDGIISGSLTSDKPMSEGASIALGALVGFYGATNSGNCTISVNDGKTGALVWKYEKALSRGLGSNINSLINTIMRKASRKFPYEE